VTPNIESIASQSHPKGEIVPEVRIPTTMDILHNQGYVYFERYILI
jgi:hypothetical protein